MVEFIVSLVVTVGLLAVYHWYAKTAPLDKKMTWGEAMLAATYVFGVFFWVYGVVPHYWLEWADKSLEWRADRLFQGPSLGLADRGVLADQNSGGWMPFTITYLVLRDLIAVAIYGAVLGANIWYWSHWQSRGARVAAAEQAQDAPSEFGRPLVRPGVR
ncbi:MAG: hypothetical protein ACR2P0_03795 [Acidimicrobiales bacterium]